jgi:hypothetical protein
MYENDIKEELEKFVKIQGRKGAKEKYVLLDEKSGQIFILTRNNKLKKASVKDQLNLLRNYKSVDYDLDFSNDYNPSKHKLVRK